MFPSSLDCPFLIVPSVFSNFYFHPVYCMPNVSCVFGLSILDCSFGFLSRLYASCVLFPMLPVSLDCPFLIVPSVFSNFYFHPVYCMPNVSCVFGLSILDCSFGFLSRLYASCVLFPMLPVSLDCPFLIVPSVFSNFYFHPVYCMPNVSCVFGLSILDCSFGFLSRLYASCVLCPMLPVSLDCSFVIDPSVFYIVRFLP